MTTIHDNDNDTRYWSHRWKASASLRQHILYKQKNGKCAWCKGPIYVGQVTKTYSNISKKDGRSNTIKNLQLVHGYCHYTTYV